MNTIRENYVRILDEIAEAAIRSNRNPEDIEFVAVTKFVATERITAAIEAGARSIGENRVQEFINKLDFFNSYGLKKNIIGQLQTNKVKYVVGEVDLIQSVDRFALADEINKRAAALGVIQKILVEVNIGSEVQKGGVQSSELSELIYLISTLPNIKVSGLMCIPPMLGNAELHSCFASMYGLFQKIKENSIKNVSMDILSMGMSGDYKIAIEEGSNMVRIGTALFGARQ